jgi:hypothetical protein
MSGVVALALLCLLPITRLLTIYTPARLIYFPAGFYESNGLVGLLDVDFAVKRLILQALAAAICFWRGWGRPARFGRVISADGEHGDEVLFVRSLLVCVVLVLITNVFGLLLLSQLLRLSILVSRPI